MPFPIDQEKWNRVRHAMAEQDVSALVVRAPDNILYLTDYWTMKGYDIAIFRAKAIPPCSSSSRSFTKPSAPRGTKTFASSGSTIRPILVRPFPLARSMPGRLARKEADPPRWRRAVAGSQICDRMVGEPSLYTQGYFDAFRGVAKQIVDATRSSPICA